MTVRDIARTIDKFAGLCVVEVRANFDDGSALVVRVVAPVEDAELIQPRLDHGADLTNGLLVQFVRVTLRSGWAVTVGSTGPAVSGPSQAALGALARDPDAAVVSAGSTSPERRVHPQRRQVVPARRALVDDRDRHTRAPTRGGRTAARTSR